MSTSEPPHLQKLTNSNNNNMLTYCTLLPSGVNRSRTFFYMIQIRGPSLHFLVMF